MFLFAKETYIRLSDDESAFIATVAYGLFYSKATEFPIHDEPAHVVVADDHRASEKIVSGNHNALPKSWLGDIPRPDRV